MKANKVLVVEPGCGTYHLFKAWLVSADTDVPYVGVGTKTSAEQFDEVCKCLSHFQGGRGHEEIGLCLVVNNLGLEAAHVREWIQAQWPTASVACFARVLKDNGDVRGWPRAFVDRYLIQQQEQQSE
jgi:hypothetical protein